MRQKPDIRRLTYTLSIWLEPQPDKRTVWRGSMETIAGQRFVFDSLAELNRLLAELGGWMDSPEPPAAPRASSDL
jgi:hypothetical protein